MLDLSYLFSFHGRMRRSHWWLSRLGSWGVIVAILAVTGGLGLLGGADPVELATDGWFWTPLLVAMPFIAWFDIATCVKRLHDTDISGWAYLIIFIPYLGGLAALVVMGCLDGTRGPNKFGNSRKWPDITREAMIFD